MKKFLVILFLFFTQHSLLSQTFGFGCLGFSGMFGGYGYQYYRANGLNNYIKDKVSDGELPSISNQDFTNGEGLLIGINVFRAKFSSTFISLKGFYQFSLEKKEFPFDNKRSDTYELNFNYFGFAIDFGIPIGNLMMFKLFDAGVSYSDVKLQIGSSDANGEYLLSEYKSEKPVIGYFVGSGLVFNIIRNYISLELTARYHFTKYNNLVNRSGKYFLNENYGNLIENSGIQTTAQLNLGIPL